MYNRYWTDNLLIYKYNITSSSGWNTIRNVLSLLWNLVQLEIYSYIQIGNDEYLLWNHKHIEGYVLYFLRTSVVEESCMKFLIWHDILTKSFSCVVVSRWRTYINIYTLLKTIEARRISSLLWKLIPVTDNRRQKEIIIKLWVCMYCLQIWSNK